MNAFYCILTLDNLENHGISSIENLLNLGFSIHKLFQDYSCISVLCSEWYLVDDSLSDMISDTSFSGILSKSQTLYTC